MRRKFLLLYFLKKTFYKLTSIKRFGSAVIKTAKKPRKLLRFMLYWMKELKSKGKYRAIRIQTKKGKTGSFSLSNSAHPARYHSSADYIMMEESYFPLN